MDVRRDGASDSCLQAMVCLGSFLLRHGSCLKGRVPAPLPRIGRAVICNGKSAA